MTVTVRQRRVLELLQAEPFPMRVNAELCSPAAMNTLARRGLVRASARGYRITKKGREEIEHGI